MAPRTHAATGRLQATVPASPPRIQYGYDGWHDAATATTNAVATGALATATANATSAATAGVQPATAHVSSHYATEPNDERARTDAKYPYEPISEHVYATKWHGHGRAPRQPHAERADARPGTNARADEPNAAELHDVPEQPHAEPERERGAAFVPLTPQHVFLHWTNYRLQP